jgi:hypothetical protein
VNETGFTDNFVWYEWGFVSPEDFPRAAFDTKPERDTGVADKRDQRAGSFDVWDADS